MIVMIVHSKTQATIQMMEMSHQDAAKLKVQIVLPNQNLAHLQAAVHHQVLAHLQAAVHQSQHSVTTFTLLLMTATQHHGQFMTD
jgi:hypothetical protein